MAIVISFSVECEKCLSANSSSSFLASSNTLSRRMLCSKKESSGVMSRDLGVQSVEPSVRESCTQNCSNICASLRRGPILLEDQISFRNTLLLQICILHALCLLLRKCHFCIGWYTCVIREKVKILAKIEEFSSQFCIISPSISNIFFQWIVQIR